MLKLKKLIARARVVLTAAPTYLIAASAAVQEFANEVPGGEVAHVASRVASVLAAAVVVLRRYNPAPRDERGLLPKEG